MAELPSTVPARWDAVLFPRVEMEAKDN